MKLMNAAGTCKDFDVARALAAHENVDEVTIGSYTPEKNEGFPDSYVYDEKTGASYNGKQMPNCGIDELCRQLPEFLAIATEAKKSLRVSVAAKSLEDFRQMTFKVADRAGEYLPRVHFEYDLACGNKPEMFHAYDPGFIERLAWMLGAGSFAALYSAVKLSPVPPVSKLFTEIVAAISNSGVIDVVACNTQPGVFRLADQFKHQDYLCSMGGEPMRPIALGMVWQLYRLLDRNVHVTACSGIGDNPTCHSFAFAGANKGQVGTAFLQEGVAVFDKIGRIPND